jgi:plasmid maintenance system antidote protein VapI
MKKQIFTTEELRDRLLSFGLSRSYAFLLSTGRRTPSMCLAGRLMNAYGLKPEFWIELNRKYKATR